jgi:hypothetical protein
MGFLVTLLISSYLMVGHVDGFSLAVALSFAASCALLRYRSLWGFEG